MQIKIPIFLSSATCLALGLLLNAEVANACPLVTPKKVCCCCVLKSQPKTRPYVELGVGQAFDSNVDSYKYSISNPENPGKEFLNLGLMSEGRALSNDILVGAGWVWSQLYPADVHYMPFMSVGLQYQYTNLSDKKTPMCFALKVFNAEGDIEEQASANADYKFSQSSLLGTLKLDLYRWAYVMPYVSFGLGASWNQAKQKEPFVTTALNTTFIQVTTPYSRNSTFSYSVGGGLDFPINENVWLSLGYNYNHSDHLTIKPFFTADNQEPTNSLNTLVKPFTLKHLSTQTIQLTGRYLFA